MLADLSLSDPEIWDRMRHWSAGADQPEENHAKGTCEKAIVMSGGKQNGRKGTAYSA